MTLHVALHHETLYRYDRPVKLGSQTIRLRPAPHCRTPITSYSLTVEPAEHFLNWQQDPQGNYLARVLVPERTRELRVLVDLVAEMSVINPFDFFLEEGAQAWPFTYEPALAEELDPFLKQDAPGPRLKRWLQAVEHQPTPLIDFLVEQNQRVQQAVDYVVRLEPGVQDPEESLALGSGSCRDSAWLLVHILRNLGIAARFASGYLIQLVPDEKPVKGPAGAAADFTDLHAWAEAYLPGAGWVGLDPTSGLLAGEGHIPLACSPKPQSAAPTSGLVEPCEVEFGHAMSVTRVQESPRVTKPYTGEQWQAIQELGEAVDRRLLEEDVRLTMGGEPTFVAADDMEGDEWNTEAVGPTKRRYAHELIERLRARLAPGGLLHYGQGKWYPGEPLPRWAFSIFWRSDGQPLWTDPKRIASETSDHHPTADQAEHFAREVATRLSIDPDFVLPAYNDPLVRLASEGGLPENVDPTDPAYEDPEKRARLIATLSQGLGEPVGFVLPVQAWNARDGGRQWMSDRWSLRRKQLFLIPGDAPVGFRLPLGSLPHLAEVDYPHVISMDPTLPRAALPAPAIRKQAPQSQRPRDAKDPKATDAAMEERPVRSALAVEPRDGRLCVFLPPVESAEAYIELVAVVEDVASTLDTAIHLEGYAPPPDHRIEKLQVTPDPGVIEVNVQPASNWRELVDNTTALYEDARQIGLVSEKFQLDGRHTGTGGGNHVVVGGATPADSPFLRRPDLLSSLVAYWVNHPALSYLFSGMFIGPTSQAPRVDEARHDSLYELELAFRQIPDPGEGECPPWLVDRILRHLLIDVTGNTHRAEFCIDKLYSPDSATGRLGLVELRAFEMPPHAQMSLAQQLLLRALIARFWKAPYRLPLARWGTSLHDRFMLPHFVWRDFCEVLAELRQAGFAFREEWFAPHFEFRFPLYGTVQYGDVEVELRQALEPWHVLGEEGAVGGTTRFVDSSLERIQARVSGAGDSRYELGCNGIALPQHATGTQGEWVAGVRFRAWQPSHCLHPTIPVHAPLNFDLVDRWSELAVAGCRYHVAHPGGRSHEQFPVNAFEAEGRRLARFSQHGHTAGLRSLQRPAVNPDFPMTLDLRLSNHEDS